jgi:GNAT superfamily N-acetyltransferase
MLALVKMRLMQLRHMLGHVGAKGVFHELFYLGRPAIVVSKDLSGLPDPPPVAKNGISISELNSDNIDSFADNFSVTNRGIKARRYISSGYTAFMATKEGKVVGDIWCNASGTKSHPNKDLDWLGIKPNAKDVYMFDMFVDPAERGNDIATHLQHMAMLNLKNKGLSLAYGYYWKDNLPAKWVHRVLRWKEVEVVRCNRILIWKWTTKGGSGDGKN